MARPHRRQFLAIGLGASGALGAALAGGWFRSSPGASNELDQTLDSALPADCKIVSRSARALGTEVTLTAAHGSSKTAARALEAAFAELERVEQALSIYRPESQLSRLNESGVLPNPDWRLVGVLQEAARVSAASDGAFDVTVQPLWELYWQSHSSGELPSSSAIEAARARVNWRNVEVSQECVRLLRPDMAVTLNGIGQGFAADCVRRVLREHGIAHALINAGEVHAVGVRPDGTPWSVGIQHPRVADAYVEVIDLTDRALATSGDYATSFSPDYRYNHIFDPRTGDSPCEVASASVLAATSTLADALSTAVFVLGPERGARLIEKCGAAAFFVLKDGRTLQTANFA